MTTAALEVRLREAEQRAQEAENVLSAAAVLHEAGISPESAEAHTLFRELVQLPDEQAMRQALREAASAPTEGKSYTAEARELLAKEGKACPTAATRSRTKATSRTPFARSGAARTQPPPRRTSSSAPKPSTPPTCCQKTGRARHGNLILRSR